MASNPVFAVTPRIGFGQVSVANTNYDGVTGTYVDIITGASTGTRIAEIVIQATATTTAGMVRLFITDGTTTRMFDEVSVAAATVSASVKGTRVSTTYNNLILPNQNWRIRASTHNAVAINVFALGADL
jgi:hypothetical protein